ncbi:MAG: hypothetical protein ACK47B_25515 [Armatimonadota bacterium]
MVRRASWFAGALAAGVVLAPGAARADVKIEEKATSLGSTVTRWTMIQGEKRAVVSKQETRGVLFHSGGHYGAYVEIHRPDRDLIWELEPQERSYREYPYEKFAQILQQGVQAPRSAEEQPLRSLYRSETTAIEVVPTGKTRKIAGFEAEQVMARVVIGAQNLRSGSQLRFSFDQEVWLTKDERLLNEVRPFEEAYVEQFGTSLTLQQARVMAGEWNDAFVLHLRAVGDRVRALGGFVLASSTTVTEEALAQSKDEKSTSRTLEVASSEVRKISFDSLPAREFELPVGFINADTKVAVAPPAGAPVQPAAQPAPKPVVKPTPPPVQVAAKPEKSPAAAGAPMGESNSAPAATGSGRERPVTAEAPAAPTPAAADKPAGPAVAQAPAPVVVTSDEAPAGSGDTPKRKRRFPKGTTGDAQNPNAAPTAPSGTPVVVVGVPVTRTPPPPVVVDEVEADRRSKKKK